MEPLTYQGQPAQKARHHSQMGGRTLRAVEVARLDCQSFGCPQEPMTAGTSASGRHEGSRVHRDWPGASTSISRNQGRPSTVLLDTAKAQKVPCPVPKPTDAWGL